jgi:hypothetical protein
MKTPFSRSSALECAVTPCDQRFAAAFVFAGLVRAIDATECARFIILTPQAPVRCVPKAKGRKPG